MSSPAAALTAVPGWALPSSDELAERVRRQGVAALSTMGAMRRPRALGRRSAAEGEDVLATLLQRSARGDQTAFAELYDATAARVHGLVLRVLRDPAQAEEVTQECFLDYWRTSTRFDATKGSSLGWMLTIAHRKAVDRVRSAEAATKRDERYERSNPTDSHDATAEAATDALEARRVRDALTKLSDTQRQAIELAYFGGYTHTEVARLLDLPLGTAKTRIRDGLIHLRDAMGVR